MYIVAVENDGRVLGDVHSVVHKILSGMVRRRHPERRVHALDLRDNRETRNRRSNFGCTHLLDDGPDVWEALFVLCRRPVITANHGVEFSVCSSLNFWT